MDALQVSSDALLGAMGGATVPGANLSSRLVDLLELSQGFSLFSRVVHLKKDTTFPLQMPVSELSTNTATHLLDL